jgi:hypothetical protein
MTPDRALLDSDREADKAVRASHVSVLASHELSLRRTATRSVPTRHPDCVAPAT